MIKPALSLIDAAIIAMTITVIAPLASCRPGMVWSRSGSRGCDPTDRLHGFAFLRNDCAETRPMIKWTKERIIWWPFRPHLHPRRISAGGWNVG